MILATSGAGLAQNEQAIAGTGASSAVMAASRRRDVRLVLTDCQDQPDMSSRAAGSALGCHGLGGAPAPRVGAPQQPRGPGEPVQGAGTLRGGQPLPQQRHALASQV